MWRSRAARSLLASWLVASWGFAAAAQATADDHWAFQPLSQPAVPQVKDTSRVATNIDAFILAGLEQRGLSLSPVAEPHALVRRVYFDLIGLPPSPDEIEAFVRDPSPQGYERLLDRLLAS